MLTFALASSALRSSSLKFNAVRPHIEPAEQATSIVER